MTDIPHFDVAIAIIKRQEKFLIAKRPPGTYMPGIWEFPGGKCENQESPEEALDRELFEELGIQAGNKSFFEKIEHDYPGRSVALFFYIVHEFAGEPHGKEGQEIRWVPLGSLSDYTFPPANEAILTALQQS